MLDNSDTYVKIEDATYDGHSKLSTVIDYGDAFIAAGLVSTSQLDSAPHTLTIFGVTGLTASDFLDTKTYYDVDGTSVDGHDVIGDARDNWVVSGSGGEILDGRGGDDLLTGEPLQPRRPRRLQDGLYRGRAGRRSGERLPCPARTGSTSTARAGRR